MPAPSFALVPLALALVTQADPATESSPSETPPAAEAEAPPPGEAEEPPAGEDGEEELPFSDPQLDYLEQMKQEIRDEVSEATAGQTGQAVESEAAPTTPSAIELKGEVFIKWLFRNNTSQGCVTYGNPHPRGDNFSGDNGACPEFALTLIGRPISKVEASARLQSRYGQQFADYFENGDLRQVPDASSESLGQNHSAPVQLRGIYVRIAEPLPLIDWFLAGSSDLSYWDPWTVGKIRFIERFNARGLFLKTSIPDTLDILVARIALSKLFGTANYNSIEEPLLTNPFWANDAIYALQLETPRGAIEGLRLTLNGALTLDEEADVTDPDAPGSVNTQDAQDRITAVAARYVGASASLTADWTALDAVTAKGTVSVSHNDPDPAYVTNLSLGGLGFSNIVFDTVTDFAGTLRVEFPDLIGEGGTLKLEYFNIGSDFNAVAGARREADVLLTDGFLDGGELPTLNLANELVDFNDVFYESAVGWHGGTAVLEQLEDFIDASVEGTFLEYNTDAQGRDMDVYPGFGGFTGYTDTQLFSYANTNDRGRDPRAVYARDQARRTFIIAALLALKPDFWRGARFEAKAKLILDSDLRNEATEVDDYSGTIMVGSISVHGQPLDELNIAVGLGADRWNEEARSGTYAGLAPVFLDYDTTRFRPYLSARYSLGPVNAMYHLEAVKKSVTISDESQSYETGLIWRSIGFLSANF